MKLTKENYKSFVPEKEQELLFSLFDSLDLVNEYSADRLYIDWQDFHDEYSYERTDPCPDYYGYYWLKFEHLPYEPIGEAMTINELDNALLLLYQYNFILRHF